MLQFLLVFLGSVAMGEPSSWGESIRAYEQAKKVLPFKREDVVPVKRVSLCEVKFIIYIAYVF